MENLKFIEAKTKEIIDRANKYPTIKVSTCNYPNWDIQEHLLMPEIAKNLQSKGYIVTRSVSFGVTDYLIAAIEAATKI